MWLTTVTLSVNAVTHASASTPPEPTGLALEIVAGVTAVWVLAMVSTGVWCGRVSRFEVRAAALVWIGSAIAITLLLLVGYVVTMSSSTDPSADTAAGAGVVVFTIPAFILVLISTGTGLGVASLAHLIRQGRHDRIAV